MCITIGAPERMKLGTPTSLFMLQIFRELPPRATARQRPGLSPSLKPSPAGCAQTHIVRTSARPAPSPAGSLRKTAKR